MRHDIQLDIMGDSEKYVLASEPGTIMNTFIGEWLASGISPANMLRAVEYIHGTRLSAVAERTLGGWATEETSRAHQVNCTGQEQFNLINDRGEQ